MIEVVLNDRLGKKVRVKCNEDDTIGDLKKLVAAQTGTRADKIRIQKCSTTTDPVPVPPRPGLETHMEILGTGGPWMPKSCSLFGADGDGEGHDDGVGPPPPARAALHATLPNLLSFLAPPGPPGVGLPPQGDKFTTAPPPSPPGPRRRFGAASGSGGPRRRGRGGARAGDDGTAFGRAIVSFRF
ncbi:hypothetical protein NL676_004270 [Syzygium grande]|nr:hypothetical protein NL676_004270 [Syzygium grande]